MREITWLKAMDEPMMMSERRQAIVVVRITERTGIEVRGSTYFVFFLSFGNSRREVSSEWVGEEKIEKITFESCAHPGKPLSLANAHVMRELEARNPMVPHIPNATTIVVMAVAPPTVPTACLNISMKGYPVGV